MSAVERCAAASLGLQVLVGPYHISMGDGARRPRFAPVAGMSAWASLAFGDSTLELCVSFGHYDPTKTPSPVILRGHYCGRGMLGHQQNCEHPCDQRS